jgi:hypothetical protein
MGREVMVQSAQIEDIKRTMVYQLNEATMVEVSQGMGEFDSLIEGFTNNATFLNAEAGIELKAINTRVYKEREKRILEFQRYYIPGDFEDDLDRMFRRKKFFSSVNNGARTQIIEEVVKIANRYELFK